MRYTTNLSYHDFLSKLKNYEKKLPGFITLRGKIKNGKAYLTIIYDAYFIPYFKSYFINFNGDNSIALKKAFSFDHILIVLMSILFVLLGFSMIYWYHVNLLIISAIFAGISIFAIISSLVNYKVFIIKTLEKDFEVIRYKK